MQLTHAPFYDNYVNSVNQPIQIALSDQKNKISFFLAEIDPSQLDFRYAPEKWSLKEVLLHCLDVERIMAVRLLMIGRGEQSELPGFDENEYVAHTESDFIQLKQIQEDFKLLRQSNISLFNMLPEKTLNMTGKADHQPISVASLWHIIVGHWNHHLKIINERYL